MRVAWLGRYSCSGVPCILAAPERIVHSVAAIRALLVAMSVVPAPTALQATASTPSACLADRAGEKP